MQGKCLKHKVGLDTNSNAKKLDSANPKGAVSI